MSRCDSYAFGNCTIGACELAGWIPDGLHDGGDWASNWAARGGQVVYAPAPGTVVCYCRGNGYSQFGHVGLVLAVYPDGTFLVQEMNFVAFDTYDQRVSNMHDVCGFLVPPGGLPGAGSALVGPGGAGGVDDVRLAWQELTDWFNSGAEHWVNEATATSNLMSMIG